MKQYSITWLITITSMVVSFFMFLPASLAAIDVDMHLNDGGFVSYDHFLAELRLNNPDGVVPDAQIFGLLEIYGVYYFWPDFATSVGFDVRDIPEGDMTVNFLEFDFPDIDDFIPFGPMNFWGAWVVSGDEYGYDVQEFWLDSAHKWTPTPAGTDPPSSPTPTVPSGSPTNTALPSTFTPTPGGNPTSTPTPAGQWEDASENIPEDGNLRDVLAIGSQVWIAGATEKIFYSAQEADAGTVETQILPDNSGNTMSISVRSTAGRALEGYVVTNYGRVLYSSDATTGGWSTIGMQGGLLYSVSFPPSGTGYCCGSSGRVFSIEGSTVTLDLSVSGATFYSIVFPVSDEGWVCGGPVIRHRDSDGWHADIYDTGLYYNAIFAIDIQNGWAVGVNGVIIHTTNGQYWNSQTNPDTNSLNDVYFLTATEGWAVGNNVILHTTDSGTTWIREVQELTEGKILLAVCFTESNKGYVVGSNKVLLRYR